MHKRFETALKIKYMNNEINILTNQIDGFSTCARFELSDFFQLNIHKHLSVIGEVFFIVRNYRESLGILPNLITSRLNQRRTIEPIETTKSACNDLTVLSCDLHNLLKVVSVSGITLLVNKSI